MSSQAFAQLVSCRFRMTVTAAEQVERYQRYLLLRS
jgi:hypothetical protein